MRKLATFSIVPFALLAIGCGEGLDSGTRCQFQSPDQVWVDYAFDLEVISPAERDCPLALTNFGQSIFMQADVTAPTGTPVSPMVWRVFDGRGFPVTQGVANFGLEVAGRQLAQPSGFYHAGLAGDLSTSNKLNQDRLKADIAVVQEPVTGVNNVYLPYRGGVVAGIAFTMLPRAKRHRMTTVRILPNNIPVTPAPQYQWYRNGVAFSPPSNPWNIGGLNGTAFNFAPPTTTPVDWKITVSYGFPFTTKTALFRQPVDP